MFNAAVLLDLAVSAVVVGEEQPLVGDQFSGAAGTEQDDGILEGGLVDAVDIFGGELEALGLHVGDALGDQGRQPHAFIRLERTGGDDERQQEQKFSFHEVSTVGLRRIYGNFGNVPYEVVKIYCIFA